MSTSVWLKQVFIRNNLTKVVVKPKEEVEKKTYNFSKILENYI